MAFGAFERQQLENARKEAAAGTPGAKEAVARLKAQQQSSQPTAPSTPTAPTTTRPSVGSQIGTSISGERDDSGSTTIREFDPTTGRTTTSTQKSQQQILAEALAAQEAAQLAAQQRILKAQQEAQIAGLRGARGGSLAALGQQRERVEPAFLQQRTGLRTQAQQAGRQTEASLAARGLARSGAQTQSDIARQIALQQGLTESGQQEAQALAGIAAGEADVERQFQTGVAQAEAGASAQQAQFALEQIRQQQAQELMAGELAATRQFQQQQEQRAIDLSERQRAADLELEEARRTQDFEREQEILRFKQDLQNEELNLRAQLQPPRVTGGGGAGVGAPGEIIDIRDAERGLSNILKQVAGQPVSVQQNRILDYAAQLRNAGVSDEIIQQLLVQGGVIGGVRAGGDTSVLGGLRQ